MWTFGSPRELATGAIKAAQLSARPGSPRVQNIALQREVTKRRLDAAATRAACALARCLATVADAQRPAHHVGCNRAALPAQRVDKRVPLPTGEPPAATCFHFYQYSRFLVVKLRPKLVELINCFAAQSWPYSGIGRSRARAADAAANSPSPTSGRGARHSVRPSGVLLVAAPRRAARTARADTTASLTSGAESAAAVMCWVLLCAYASWRARCLALVRTCASINSTPSASSGLERVAQRLHVTRASGVGEESVE